MKTINQEKIADRLQEIKDQIKELVEESRNLVDEIKDQRASNRAASYWLAQMQIALDDSHRWVGGAGETMQETIDELRESNETQAGK